MSSLNNKWIKTRNGNYYIQKVDWYLSYNDTLGIGMFDCWYPELAICKNGSFAIIHDANPSDFENIDSYDEAIKLAKKLIDSGNCSIAVWNGYDFSEVMK